jgi:hypothetical protein
MTLPRITSLKFLISVVRVVKTYVLSHAGAQQRIQMWVYPMSCRGVGQASMIIRSDYNNVHR